MKYIYSLLITLSLSFNALAALNPAEQKVADKILTGQDAQLKAAAKIVKSRSLHNPELLDMLAEILLKRYEGAYPREVDTLAWVARAIGSSENGRYHTALTQVYSGELHKKFRRHVDSALDDLGDASGEQYVAGMYSLPEGLYERESAAERDSRIVNLIMEGDLGSLKEAAKWVVITKPSDTNITDMLAEQLLVNHTEASDDQIDTLSWICKALGASASGRYANALALVEENGAHRKLRNYAEESLEIHGGAKGEQYQQGMIAKKLPTLY